MRSCLLIAGAGLVGALAGLAFASDGFGYVNSQSVSLTASGPSPSTLKMGAGAYMLFENKDSVTHTVVFANGHCSLTLTPGAVEGPGNSVNGSEPTNCMHNFPFYVGSYAYSVDGNVPGRVETVAASRSVTLTARTHKIRRGERLTLHGQVAWNNQCCDSATKVPFPIVVLTRHRPNQPFDQAATLTVRKGAHGYFWRLRVRPGATTTYIAEANGQLPAGQIWKPAKSRPFTVRLGS